MFLNFRTGFIVDGDHVVYDSKLIAQQYLRGWLIVDVVSGIPFDLLELLTPEEDGSEVGATTSNTRGAKILKVGRMFKTVKILRLAKLLKVGVWCPT